MTITANSLTTLLEVYDMRCSVAFYCDLLGFDLVDSADFKGNPYWAMLKLGGATLMLNARYEDDERPPTPPDRPGHDDTELNFDCPDVDAAYAHLREKGCDISAPVVRPYRTKQIHLHDPDGFHLCFQQRAS